MPDTLKTALGQTRNLSTICSTNCYSCSIKSIKTKNNNHPRTIARCELNTHADTCVAEPDCQLDNYTGEFCDATPYSADYKS